MRVAIDIGGTFTDLCLVTETGEFFSHKILTTPDDPAAAFHQILQEALAARGRFGRELKEVLHATTIATNAILEGKTARLGLITGDGFRDVLEIGRHFRRNLYSFFIEKPPVLVPRERRLEVSERIDAAGKILRPISRSAVVKAGRALAAEGVEAIVICFINSYANPRHERMAVRWLTADLGLPALPSHQLCWECREFERFSTAVINGAVLPRVVNYLRRLREGMRMDGIKAELGIMQSNGGLTGVDAACRAPAGMVESGPAAGVIAAAAVGRRLGIADIVAFDMGGTTAKAGLIEKGQVAIRRNFEVGGGMQGGFGTGYPLMMPAVDLVEVGTGGGSICRISDGRFTVGPDSAGARPGPACYGLGGHEPTISDAHAALGRLAPEFFGGGRFRLDLKAAREAIRKQLGVKLGTSVEKAAGGVLALADLQMVQALRLVTVQRGLDPRDFVLITFGGAGPMHAASLLRELGGKRAVIPPEAGVQSAWGLLVADMRRDFQRSIFGELAADALPLLAKTCARNCDTGRKPTWAGGDFGEQGSCFAIPWTCAIGARPTKSPSTARLRKNGIGPFLRKWPSDFTLSTENSTVSPTKLVRSNSPWRGWRRSSGGRKRNRAGRQAIAFPSPTGCGAGQKYILTDAITLRTFSVAKSWAPATPCGARPSSFKPRPPR